MRTINGKPLYPFVVGDNNTGQCSSCGEVFYGEQAFDYHRRAGSCLEPATAVSVRGNPMPYRLDGKGRWHYGPRRDRATIPNQHVSTDLEPTPHVAGTITPTSLSTAV